MKINHYLLKSTLVILFLLGTKVYGQHNPVIEGWYADPEGIKYGNTYWIYPTYSAPYKDQVFMDAFSSTDLKNWKKHPRIIDTSGVKWAKKAMWAPAVLKKANKYYLFFGANDIHPGEVGGIGVAVASKPDGPYKDLLGHPLIDTIVNGAQPIDQFVFRDKDGSYYMYYGGWGHCNMVKLKSDFSGIEPLPDGTLYKEITPEHYVEGPYMFIRNNKYYFMWSEGGWTGPDYKVAYAMADSPFGPFKRLSTVLEQDPKIARGAGHHSVIHSAKDDKYYIVYHRRPLDQTGANQRVICLDQMLFDKEGHILPVKMTFSWMAK